MGWLSTPLWATARASSVLAAEFQEGDQSQAGRGVPRSEVAEGLFGLGSVAEILGLQKIIGHFHLQGGGIFRRLECLAIGIGRLGVVLVGPLGPAHRDICQGILGVALNTALGDCQGFVRLPLRDGLIDAPQRKSGRFRHLLSAEGLVAVGFRRPLLRLEQGYQRFVDRLPLTLGRRFQGIDDRQGLLVGTDGGIGAAGRLAGVRGGQVGRRFPRLQERRLLEGCQGQIPFRSAPRTIGPTPSRLRRSSAASAAPLRLDDFLADGQVLHEVDGIIVAAS